MAVKNRKDHRSKLEEMLIEHQAKQIAKDLDFIILSNTLVETDGWIKITLTPMDHEKSTSIDRWLVNDCQGKHMFEGLVFVFERQADAVMFALKFA